MSELKPMKRQKLTEEIRKAKNNLKKGVFMITSFRPTKDNSIQVEVCQNRQLGGRKQTLLGLLNRSDDRFGSETTLLFDWLTFKPADFIAAFPESGVSLKDLEDIAAQWSPTLETGSDAIVYPRMKLITKIMDSVNEVELTPVIVVTEVTHSQLVNGEFFRGKNAEQQIENTLEKGSNVMKTGSSDEDEFLVHPDTGEKVYRFTRTEFAENKPTDSLIEGKMTESQYKKTYRTATAAQTVSPEQLGAQISGGTEI